MELAIIAVETYLSLPSVQKYLTQRINMLKILAAIFGEFYFIIVQFYRKRSGVQPANAKKICFETMPVANTRRMTCSKNRSRVSPETALFCSGKASTIDADIFNILLAWKKSYCINWCCWPTVLLKSTLSMKYWR